jgi:hypothetical protein
MATTKIQSFPGDVKVTSNLSVDTDTLHVDYVSNRVGIGKTNPAFTCDVSGTVNATSLNKNGSTFSSTPWVENGNDIYVSKPVGIGTDFPKRQLEVQGAFILSNTSDTQVTLRAVGANLDVGLSRIKANGTILSFTGQHLCFPDGPLSQGQIVSANKNKYVSLNGPLTNGLQAIKSSESLPVVSLSNVVNDRTVFGVVDHIENGGNIRLHESGVGVVRQYKELGDNRVIVNSLGEGAIWVVNTNGNLSSGDYITTSNVTGYGQKQDDNKLHSYTVAKITMDCDFNTQDVPIQMIKKDENGQNILDSYGRLQWEDTDEIKSAPGYVTEYITVDGQSTDEANAAWKAAYVGCTYHCG